MIKKSFIIVLLCLVPAVSFAVTREEAVRYALENSEAIRMVMETSQSLRADGDQATAFTKPRLTLSAGYLEMGDNKPESPFFASPGRNIVAEARISQLIFAGGRIWKSRDMRDNLHKQADILETSGKRDIAKQVRAAFDAVLYQQAALNILKDRVKQRRAELEDAQDLKEAGAVTSLDVRQAKLNLNFARDQLEEGEAAYQESLISFNLAIGRSGGEELLIPKGNLEKVPDLNAILNQLRESLSTDDLLDIKFVETQLDAAWLNYDIAGGEGLPEVVLAGTGKSDGERSDDMNEGWTIGFQASWNIFDGGLARAKKASAWANMKKTEESLSQTKKLLAGEIETVGVNIESLKQRISLQQEAVELSRENYEDARGHYRAGMITLTRFGEFNLSYAEARFNLLRIFFLRREQLTRAEALLEE